MVISKKQHDANRRNSQNSTGPVTQEGKAAAAMNAVTYGLRTRKLIITGENIADYWRLWSGLEDEWQPETPTERLCLEQMSVSQWMLARMAASEQRIHEEDMTLQARFDLLDRVARHVTRFERSFYTALHELQRLQKERRRQEAAKAKQTKSQPNHPVPDAAEDHSAFSDPAATDTR